MELTPKKKKTIVLAVIACAVLLTAGMVLRSRGTDVKYLTAPVEQGNITATVQATGTINPLTTVPVGSYVSGTVKYVFADFNTTVQAGQVLAQLDPAIYEAQVMQARGNLANAEANVANLVATIGAQKATINANQADVNRLKAAYDYAAANAQRSADLFSQGIVARDPNQLAQANAEQAKASLESGQAQVATSEAELKEKEAQLEQARAQVKVMEGALKQAETNLRYTTIVSPINGTVVSKNVTVGQSVAASLQAPNVFTVAQDLKRMEVDAQVDESDTGHIHVGAEADFQVDAFPSQTFRGQVSAIRLNATTVQNVVTYDVVIDFENPEEKLLPGETAYVTIPTGQANDVTKIPNAALRFTPSLPQSQIRSLYQQYNVPKRTSQANQQIVWKLGPKDTLIPVAVKTGITDYTYTQLEQGNVKPDDTLVVAAVSSKSEATPARSNAPGFGGGGRGRH